jgi:hypothetical protein
MRQCRYLWLTTTRFYIRITPLFYKIPGGITGNAQFKSFNQGFKEDSQKDRKKKRRCIPGPQHIEKDQDSSTCRSQDNAPCRVFDGR